MGRALIGRGPTLLEYLDAFQGEARDINAPLTMPVSEKYNDLGVCVMGKIETGRVKKGDRLTLMPNKNQVEVVAVMTEESVDMEYGFAGDNVRMRLKGLADGESYICA
jgi:peptide chain release factor subunit 3